MNLKRWMLVGLIVVQQFMALGQLKMHKNDCVHSRAHEIEMQSADTFQDLMFLKEKIKHKRIVLLGESAHTIGDYYVLKTRLVKFLHQECGFEVFAMESGIADVYTIFAQIDTLSAVQLMKKTLYANLSCNEMAPLFDYIKTGSNTPNPLQYYGFDSQNHGASLSLIKFLLHDYYGTKSDSLVDNLYKYYHVSQLEWKSDKTEFFNLSDTISSSAAELIKMWGDVKTKIQENKKLTGIHLKILERSLYNHKNALLLDWNTENALAKRDSLMADNLLWLANEIFPDKKIIVWAHNTHIDKGGTDVLNKSMGYHLTQMFKGQTYHIGLYAKTGALYWWWTKDTRSFHNEEPDDIEAVADKFPITFMDTNGKGKKCATMTRTLMGYEAEFGRKISFIPAKRYDAIINFRQVAASTY